MKRRINEIALALAGEAVYLLVVFICMFKWHYAGLLWSMVAGPVIFVAWSICSARQKRDRWRPWESLVVLAIAGVLCALLWPAVPRDLSWRSRVVTDLCFSPDSRFILWRTRGIVHVQETESGREVRSIALTAPTRRSVWPFAVLAAEPPAATPHSMAVTPDGAKLLALIRDEGVAEWDVRTGRRERTLLSGDGWRHVAMTSEGRRLVADQATSRSAGRGEPIPVSALAILDMPSGRRVRSILRPVNTCVRNMVLSSDGGLWVLTDDAIEVWNVRSGRREHTLTPAKLQVWPLTSAMAIDGRGARLVTRQRNSQSSGAPDSLVVWDTGAWKPIRRLKSSVETPYATALSPDGRVLAESDSDSVHLRNINGNGTEQTLAAPSLYHGLAFSPDGKWLAAAMWDNGVKVWRVSSL